MLLRRTCVERESVLSEKMLEREDVLKRECVNENMVSREHKRVQKILEPSAPENSLCSNIFAFYCCDWL